jgi:hypothetical protein
MATRTPITRASGTAFAGGKLLLSLAGRDAEESDADGYVEGNWTPVLTFGTPGDLNVAYTSQAGHYTKIGRLVAVAFTILTSTFTHTTASGNCQITGLPFAAAGNTNYFGSCAWQGITKANYTQVTPIIAVGTSAVQFFISGSGQANAAVGTGDMPTGGTVLFSCNASYFV